MMANLIRNHLPRFYFCMRQSLIADCYNSENIPIRIQSFSKLLPLLSPSSTQSSLSQLSPLQLSQSQLVLSVPSYISMTTAKPLQQFHISNNTPVTLSILHALAFIQFNAFQGYVDTLLRFAYTRQHAHIWTKQYQQNNSNSNHNHNHNHNHDQLIQFRQDIINMAKQQGQHCLILINRLKQLGCQFGQYPVITNLTNTISKTSHDLIDRLALVSVVHQGKGMKAIDKLIKKIKHAKDNQSAKLLKIIQKQQIKHYKTGLKWFNTLCANKIKISSRQNAQYGLQNILDDINVRYKTHIKVQDVQGGSHDNNHQIV